MKTGFKVFVIESGKNARCVATRKTLDEARREAAAHGWKPGKAFGPIRIVPFTKNS